MTTIQTGARTGKWVGLIVSRIVAFRLAGFAFPVNINVFVNVFMRFDPFRVAFQEGVGLSRAQALNPTPET